MTPAVAAPMLTTLSLFDDSHFDTMWLYKVSQ